MVRLDGFRSQDRTRRAIALGGLGYLLLGLGASGPRGVGDAVPQVLVEQGQRHGLQRLRRGADLRQDVDAVRVVLDHPLQASDLALDTTEAVEQGLLLGDVSRLCAWHRDPPSSTPSGYPLLRIPP